MKSRARLVLFAVAWLTILAATVSSRLSREWRKAAPHPGVEMCGPAAGSDEYLMRQEAKRRIANEVLEGRMPLCAAAAAFRRMDDPPPSWLRLAERFNGASKDEAYGRSVILYVLEAAPPERAEEATSRLRAELGAWLREGTLHLSDVQDANQAGDDGD